MMATLDALRTLVRVNLSAGAAEDFGRYLMETAEQRVVNDAFNRAADQWDPFSHVKYPPGSGWPGALRGLEAYAKELLDGT